MPAIVPSPRSLIVRALLLFVVCGCTTTEVSPRLPTVVPNGPTSIPTDPDATPQPTVPSQTDTAWGRIWDGLPRGFPEYPGAAPTETGEGPASAILDVGDVEPAEVAGYYVAALELLGYSTLSRSDPREDGSIEVEWAGETTCRIRMTSTPLGGTTIVDILYGAGCPFE
jgi:hypothetical protein